VTFVKGEEVVQEKFSISIHYSLVPLALLSQTSNNVAFYPRPLFDHAPETLHFAIFAYWEATMADSDSDPEHEKMENDEDVEDDDDMDQDEEDSEDDEDEKQDRMVAELLKSVS
jgi:hypothetical protein